MLDSVLESPATARPTVSGPPAGAGLKIGEVARRVGVSPHTLRAWQRRHGVMPSAVTDGGQRRYSDADVSRLLQIRRLVQNGLSVQAAVDATGTPPPPATSTSPTPTGLASPGCALEALPSDAVDVAALRASVAALRRIVHARSDGDLVAALASFIETAGGSTGPADLHQGDVIPLDIGLGGEPLLPRAEPYSLARMRIEAHLPALVDDARAAAARLRRS